MDNQKSKGRWGSPESAQTKRNGAAGPAPSRDYAAYVAFGLALAILITSGIFTALHLSKGSGSIPEREISGWMEDLVDQGKDLLDRFSGGAVSKQDPAQEAKRHLQKGHRLYSKSRFKEALEECGKAVRLDPGNPEACYWKGRALMRLQRYDEALVDFQKAAGLKPDYREAHDNLAWLHERKKDYDQALSHLDKSIQLSQDNGWAYYHRAKVLDAKGETAKALEDAKRACDLKNLDGCRFYEEHKR